jgi:ABC-2 type transport system ATP-binding protein
MAAVLRTQGLRKTYGSVTALRGLDLEVRKGEVFGFLGPNGAGKTTFTKCITGFVRPDAGMVEIGGIDALRHPTQAAYHVGLVPDQYDFYPNLTGRQHLDFYGRLLGMGKDQRQDRVAKVLAQVRMEERADSRVKGYSHGMKQRICIAQAILHEPQLILFDEPTNGLDPQGAYELRQMIKGLASGGATVFLNSHQLSEVEQTCERVAILDRGVLKAVAPVAELKSRAAGGRTQIEVLNPTRKLAAALAEALDLKPSEVAVEGGCYTFPADGKATATAVAAVVAAGGKVVAVRPQQGSLEEAFLDVLGGA